jgi:glycine cleavage system pyridoxal-binding protein P
MSAQTSSSDPARDHAVLGPFVARHVGPDAAEQRRMLSFLGYASLHELAIAAVPENIRSTCRPPSARRTC